MGKQVLIVNASPRKGGNSERLAKEFAKGAEEAGHQVKTVCLTGKTLNFCRGCLACQASGTGHCVMRDDADAIVQEMRTAQVLVFSTPIYFYEMCGQLKTLLDRTNPLFPVEYGFRDIYLIAAAADGEESAMDGAVKGLQGWIDCFEGTALKGVLRGVGVTEKGDADGRTELLAAARDMGRGI